MTDENLPQFLVQGDVIPEVWEKALELLWTEGCTSLKESYRFEEAGSNQRVLYANGHKASPEGAALPPRMGETS